MLILAKERMAIKTYLKVATALLLAAALGVAAAVVIVPRLLALDTCKAQILAMAQKSLSRTVSYQTASFSWHFAPSFVFRGITIAETSGNTTFLKVDRLTFKLSILPLLRREVRLKEIVVERPELMLNRNQAGVFNIDDLLRGKPSEFSIHLRSVRIINGLVRFTDRLADPEGFTTSLEKLDLYVNGLDRGKSSAFKVFTMVPGEKGQSAISLSGTARIPGHKESIHDATFDVTLSAKNLAPGRFWRYYGRYLPFEKVRGNLDLDGRFKGKPNEFSAKGQITINDLRLNYPQVFHAPLTPKEVRLAYELELTPRDISVKSFDLTVDGLRATGSCALGDMYSGDPRITARAAISPFRLEEFRQYIPYGVIVKDTADYIERHITGGVYRLDEGRLDGRVSQILHMERGDNYNVLFIRGHVEKGLVSYGSHVPTFNNVKGDLEMRGKNFFLRRVTGNFGGSPFTLEGKIADYPLATPASYPFTMTITPGEAEVAWLFRQGKPGGMAFSGRSLLRLSGSGSTSDYGLTGSWDLSGADYRYRDSVHKPAGVANRLRFTARLGKAEARLADFRYELPPLDVTAGATLRYDNREPLTFAVGTNRFLVDPLLPILPGLAKYHPSGTVQAHISGSGNPAEPDGIRLKGDVTIAKFSVRPLERIKPLSGITGTIHVTEATLETGELTGMVGDSAFTIGGRVAGLVNPTADLVFLSPELHPEDFGFYFTGQVPEVKSLSGAISLKDGTLTIASLSGEVNRLKFTMNGEVLDIGTPKIFLHVDFPYLRVEDLAPLTRLKRAGDDEEHPQEITLKAQVTSAAGSVRDIPFKQLDTELSLEHKRLEVHSLSVGVFGGSVSGSGGADFAADGGPMYQVRYRMNHVDVAQLLGAAGVKRQITGQLAAEGELTSQGINREDLYNTAQGYAEITLTDGIYRFPESYELRRASEFPFKTIQTRLSIAGKVIDIHSGRIEAFGGIISGAGGADFSIPDGPAYRFNCQLASVDAASFFRAFDVSKDISGLLTLRAELTARGDRVLALGKTVQGLVTVHLEKGIIKNYGFISKVFSILNVSQLLDFRLPDMVSTGMPYDVIDGTYSFNKGTVSTSDLSIHSPSLNMTIVGEADLVNREIDAKIGVQPLQTVSKIVNRIPIIGWVLSGGEKRFLVVYYEAKGKIDNPTVTAIPMTSLPRGILNIFRRAFNLPGELTTDPGKVLLGK